MLIVRATLTLACLTVMSGCGDLQRSQLRAEPGTFGYSEKGEQLFQTKGCGTCHYEGGEHIAPSIQRPRGERVVLSDGSSTTWDETYILKSIVLPEYQQRFGGYAPMPQLNLSEQEAADITAYLISNE